MDWNNTIAQVQPALKLLLVTDGKHRIRTTERSQAAGSLTRLTIGDDAGNAQLLGCLDSSMSQEELLVNLSILHRINVVERRLVLLCLFGDARHSLNSLYRILTASCFARKHQGICTVEDSVGNICNLGTCRTRILDHGVEHLCSHDYRFLSLHALGDDAALDTRDSLDRHLNTQVTTGNHNAIAGFDDLIDVIYTLLVLDLRDNLDVAVVSIENILHGLYISCIAHE